MRNEPIITTREEYIVSYYGSSDSDLANRFVTLLAAQERLNFVTISGYTDAKLHYMCVETTREDITDALGDSPWSENLLANR